MLINSPSGFDLVDLTSAVRNIPIQWGSFNTMGIFTEESVTSEQVLFQESTYNGSLIVDRVRGEKTVVSSDPTRKMHSFLVPHYPLSDYISPKDLQSRSAYDDFSQEDQLQKVRQRKLERLAQNHDWTLNKARAQALFSATVYAPSGTVVQNWNTEFSVSRDAVDFALGTSTTEVLAKIEEVIQYIQNNMSGEIFTGIIIPCDTLFFNALIKHPSVQNAYKYFQSIQAGDPMRTRLSTNGSPLPMYREFPFGGVTFREVRDAYNGTKIVTSNEGVAVPQGSDMFKTFFAPCDRFSHVNTAGERMYVFEQADTKGTKIELDSESNNISALLRPQGVVRIYTSN